MLVLSRKECEGIKIGEDVTVQVVRVHGNRVTLGITAPREVRIVRTEIPTHPEATPDESDADPHRQSAA